MGKLLTVTIPAYNAEEFLAHCLDSLLSATSRAETELLVVNDGSQDRTGEIAERYAANYPEIVRVIHKENGGHGSGINAGIKAATGKYFRVVDSDDMVDSEAYEAYLQKLKQFDCDLIATPFVCVASPKAVGKQSDRMPEMAGKAGKARVVSTGLGRTASKSKQVPPEKVRQVEGGKNLPREEELSFEKVAERLHVRMHEWTIRTSILKEHSIQMREHSFYVDMQYILFPIPWIRTCCILDLPVYCYRLGNEGQSVSVRNMQKNRWQHQQVIQSLIDFYKERVRAGDSKERLAYLARGIAKMQANQVQIVLSLPIGKAAKQELLETEKRMRQECPAAYAANEKKSLWLLRKSGYLLYHTAAVAWRLIKR